MHKRKHRKSIRDGDWDGPATSHVQSTEVLDPDPRLYVQAHEADVIRGRHAASACLLEFTNMTSDSRSGLVRWGPREITCGADTAGSHQVTPPVLWVDRYDVRLLLDNLPDFQSRSVQVRLPSPSGWSDLPSDSEDTFFFSPDEVEDYRREKRRRLIEHGREERLRALEIIDDPEKDSDPWGGSDEEPEEAQKELIRRTASHIISSPNPAQLEMRILANYGTDKRFAFLRGRWSRAWRTEKERARQSRAEEAKKTDPPTTITSLGGLANYGDSDTDGEESGDRPTVEQQDATDTLHTQYDQHSDDAVKEARRARAKEWSARRRAERPESRPEERER